MQFLVVDDQSTNRAILKWLLEEDGHEVIEAVDGAEAVAAYERNSECDVILMDVMMPVMDGIEATRQIKNRVSGDVYIPVIFLTALDDDEALSKCLASGGDDFLSKPYNEAVLKAKIAAHVRIRELTKQLAIQNKALTLHNSRWQREQNIVQHIFTTALQHNLSECGSLKSYVSPASTFNGDILLSAPSASGGLYVFLGDFTGHGLGASIGTLPIAHSFEQLTRRHMSVGEIAFEFNRMLNIMLPDYMFCAATILELSSKGDSIQIWIGGLPDGYLIAADGSLKDTIKSQNMPLGIERDSDFKKGFEVKNLAKDERVLFFTDGLDEAENPEGEFFTEERIRDCFHPGCENSLQCVLSRLKEFTQDAEQRDDISIVEVSSGEVQLARQDSNSIKPPVALNWELHTRLTAEEIKTTQPVEEIMSILGAQTILRPNKDVIGLLLAEIYSNALEHGILGLSSKLKKSEDGFMEYYQERQNRLDKLNEATIDIQIAIMDKGQKVLNIRMQDSGKGFEHSDILNSDQDDSFGRGITLLKRVCSRVDYLEGGCCIDLDFPIDQTAHLA